MKWLEKSLNKAKERYVANHKVNFKDNNSWGKGKFLLLPDLRYPVNRISENNSCNVNNFTPITL